MVMLSSCSSVKFAIMSGDENLQALTKVTDKDSPCITPFGGDDGKDLYFAVQEKGMYYNIYKKDNPFAAAISQKTSGKNRNYSPAYCAGAQYHRGSPQPPWYDGKLCADQNAHVPEHDR